MPAKIKFARSTLLCLGVVAVAGCTYRPPQTGFYCVNIPEGRSAEANRFVQTIAERLNFKVSKAEFPSERGPPSKVWDVYGSGVSLFVGTAMKDGTPDRLGNIETTFNPNRLDLHVAQTGLWRRIKFEKVVSIARSVAREHGLSFTQAPAGKSCST